MDGPIPGSEIVADKNTGMTDEQFFKNQQK